MRTVQVRRERKAVQRSNQLTATQKALHADRALERSHRAVMVPKPRIVATMHD
eukprot:COSAG05_NODE_590_length_8500_cov_9.363290_6_plen_53_part_00